MRVLIYKQTHIGDPDKYGCWGQTDCMGRVRDIKYDAVIGAGGISGWPQKVGIAGKVTWIGLTATKFQQHGYRGSIVQFRKFIRLETNGPLLSSEAPVLAKRLYGCHPRYFIAKGKELQDAKALIKKYLGSRPNGAPPNKSSNRTHKPLRGSCSRSASHCGAC